MHTPDRPPLRAEAEELLREREHTIAFFEETLRGQKMDEALQSVLVRVEEAPEDPPAPEVDARVFGPAAKVIAQLLAAYRLWTNRVYIGDVFVDHLDRTHWRQAFRNVFGKAGQQRLHDMERMDKYRVAPTIGLTTALSVVANILLESDEPEDVALAHAITAAWNEQSHLALYAHYAEATDAEKQATNAAFGKQFSAALVLLADTARGREALAA